MTNSTLVHSLPPVAGRKWCIALLLVVALSLTATAQQRRMKLARIQIDGLQRLSSDEVVATTGLKVNESYEVDALDAAAQRLVDSGLFKNVAYRTRTISGLTTIIFQVVELKSSASPVVFDNFVWFTDQELAEGICRDVPSFAGMASDAGNMTDLITRALQRLIKERNLPGSVEYMPSQSESGRGLEHLFSVTGVSIPVCSLHFPGSKAVSEEALIKNSKELAGSNFSRQGARVFATARLFPLYREVGHLRVKFGQPVAKLAAGVNCKNGVDLMIPVEEGATYSWAGAVWSGSQAMSPASLDDALGMKNGEVANGVKYDKGLVNVRRTYGRKGHLLATLRDRLEFDDAARLVTYKIEVSEGPQFRMGNLIVNGFTPGEERFLREAWRLTSGDVFDQGYLDEFLKTSFGVVMTSVGQRFRAEGKDLPKKVETAVRPNRQTLTVDVTLAIEN